MTGAEWFVVGIVLMQWGAACWYAIQSRLPETAMWFLAGGSNLAWVWKIVHDR